MNYIIELWMLRLKNGFLSAKNVGKVFLKPKDTNTVELEKEIKERNDKHRRDYSREIRKLVISRDLYTQFKHNSFISLNLLLIKCMLGQHGTGCLCWKTSWISFLWSEKNSLNNSEIFSSFLKLTDKNLSQYEPIFRAAPGQLRDSRLVVNTKYL